MIRGALAKQGVRSAQSAPVSVICPFHQATSKGARTMASTFREVDAARPRSQSRPTLESFMDDVATRDPGESEFHQAVHEVVESVWP